MRKRRTREMLGRVSPHLGPWLVSLRTRSGLTQAQLAERARVSRSLVSAAERGEIPPSVDALASLARPLGAPTAALLALAGYAPDPLGCAVADMEASFLRAARRVAAGTAALLRAEFSHPTSGVRLAAQHLAYRRRLAGLPVEEALARAAPLDAPPPATVEAAEAAAAAPGDEAVLKRLALMDSERWVGWSIGVGGDPDLVLWLIGRLPDELIDAAGLGLQMAARRKALERALELDAEWRLVEEGAVAEAVKTGEDADLLALWREGGLWAVYDALLARSLARTEASGDAGGEDGMGMVMEAVVVSWGEYVKGLIAGSGKSLRQVAEAAGINPTYLSRIARGHVPSDAVIDRLAAALGVPASEMRAQAGGAASEVRLTDEAARLPEIDRRFASPGAAIWRATRRLLLTEFGHGREGAWERLCAHYPMFLALRGRSPATVQAIQLLMRAFCRPEDLAAWFDGFSAEEARLMLHAIAFTRDPLGYAAAGGLRLDGAFRFRAPDDYLPLPSWVWDEVVAEVEAAG
ncbi:MAG: helix-turn-helix transcriptional regulator [Firmicutes bacterium]|nr:helix-turn-helix transcriptional regulator [Bacillota bacterium]